MKTPILDGPQKKRMHEIDLLRNLAGMVRQRLALGEGLPFVRDDGTRPTLSERAEFERLKNLADDAVVDALSALGEGS